VLTSSHEREINLIASTISIVLLVTTSRMQNAISQPIGFNPLSFISINPNVKRRFRKSIQVGVWWVKDAASPFTNLA
jgi:hypothetical protein